ncbi:MAG: hypothetical protein LC769_13300, partial [Chloroflexi bacterium]|nr:hypothetical protein [Chloroflexota bacterium]
ERPSHGPYWYAYYRDEHGRLHSRYVGKTRPEDAVLPNVAASTHVANARGRQTPPSLRIRLFGGLAVERGGHIIQERDWHRAPARALFSLLLLHPAGLLREQVCDILWPDDDEPTAAQALKTALSMLRHLLEPSVFSEGDYGESQRLPPRERLVRLRLFPDDWLDIRLFTANPDPAQLTLPALTDIVALYGGELLPEYRYDDWAATARESLRGRWRALSLQLAQRLSTVGQAAAAMDHARAVLSDDGTQEEAARLLMTLYAEQGQRGAALQVYQHLVETLRQEIGVAPDPVTRALSERLRDTETASITPIPALHEQSERIQKRIADLVARPANAARERRLARLQAEHALVLIDLGQPELARSAVESGRLLLE